MANICSCELEVRGRSAGRLLKRIQKQDPKLENEFTWFLESPYYGLYQDPNEIEHGKGWFRLDFSCKWSPPTSALMDLSARYSSCEFKLRHEESGNQCFGIIEVCNGEVTKDQAMEEEEYLAEYHTEYKEELKTLKGYTDEEVLKFFREKLTGYDEYSYGRHLETRYLERIKDEDLPLLVGHEWLDDTNRDTFNKRLKKE